MSKRYGRKRFREGARNQVDGKSRNVTLGYYLYREGCCAGNFIIIRGVTAMELIDVITSKENLNRAYKKVVANKGAGLFNPLNYYLRNSGI